MIVVVQESDEQMVGCRSLNEMVVGGAAGGAQ